MKPAFIIFTMLISISALGQNYNLEWSTRYDEYFLDFVNKEDNKVGEIVVRLGTSPIYSYKIYDGAKYIVKYSFSHDHSNTIMYEYGEAINYHQTVDANNDGIYDMIAITNTGLPDPKIEVLDGRNGTLLKKWMIDAQTLTSVYFRIFDIDNDGYLELCFYYSSSGDNIRHLSIFSTPAKVVVNYDNDDTLPDKESIQNYQNQVNPSPVIE